MNYIQDDWPKWLPLGEFAVNDQVSECTKIFLFFANTGWDPRITTDLDPPARGPRDDARAHGPASRIAEIHEFARTSMIDAQQCYQDQADKQKTPTPHFCPGDPVWFLCKNMRFA